MTADFKYVFPAIRGIQARREYYVSMCPLRLIPRLFIFNGEEMAPELRAQRHLNKARIPEMSRYMYENPDDYVFSALTASIDGEVAFEQLSWEERGDRIGLLHIPMAARFVINDGQHRRAAIEMALEHRPDIGEETIAVVFFRDVGLERCQQMFADLNRYAVRPSKSLGFLYDHRDETAELAKTLIKRSPVFGGLVELEKTTLSRRSRRLFTLSAIYNATAELVKDFDLDDPKEEAELAITFWEEVARHIKEWELVRAGNATAGEVRTDYIHTHGVVLQALARAGNVLIRRYPRAWRKKIGRIADIDWRRVNAELWEGRALLAGRLRKSQNNVTLTSNAIKTRLGLPLSPDEQRIEDAFGRNHHDGI